MSTGTEILCEIRGFPPQITLEKVLFSFPARVLMLCSSKNDGWKLKSQEATWDSPATKVVQVVLHSSENFHLLKSYFFNTKFDDRHWLSCHHVDSEGKELLSKEPIEDLASDFLLFWHAQSYPSITTRETMGDVFQQFLTFFPPTLAMKQVNPKIWKKTKRVESKTSMILRRNKWIRLSKRHKATDLIVIRVVAEDRRTFPSILEQQEGRKALLEQQQNNNKDKFGVTLKVFDPKNEAESAEEKTEVESEKDSQSTNKEVSITPVIINAHIGGDPTSVFVQILLSEQNASVMLTDKEVKGANKDVFQEENDASAQSLTLPYDLNSCSKPPILKFKIQSPTQVALLRVRLCLSFVMESHGDDSSGRQAFTINRSIAISCGYPALQACLRPSKPYKKRNYKKLHETGTMSRMVTLNCTTRDDYKKRTKNRKGSQTNEFIVHWPEKVEPKTNPGQRKKESQKGLSFRSLGRYSLPIGRVQSKNGIEKALEKLDWSPKTTLRSRACISSDTWNEDSVSSTNEPLSIQDEIVKSSIDDYGSFWSNLLYASEYQMYRDMLMFSMTKVQLRRVAKSMFGLVVPGLAEGRPSVLRGDTVNLTWKKQVYKGLVHNVELLQVNLIVPKALARTFNADIDRIDTVDFTFSRTALRTSHKAVLQFASQNLGANMLQPTCESVQAARSLRLLNPSRPVAMTPFVNRNLNAEQKAAIRRVVQEKGGSSSPYIVFGPPGTGKTTVIVEMIYQLAKRQAVPGGDRILLVAPSNDAADILVQRLAQYFPPSELLRVLSYTRNKSSLPPDVQPYINNNETESDEETARKIMQAKIVVTTVNLASRFVYKGVPKGHFSIVCVDEAGHATEPEVVGVAASLLQHGQLILAGDPQQLGPIMTSKICEAYGLGVSLMERLCQRVAYQRDSTTLEYPSDMITKLVRNYRSHSSILSTPSAMFYDNELEACGDPMVTQSMTNWEYLPKRGFPILFHSMKGNNLREANSPSWFNPEEAQQVVTYVNLLLRDTKPPLKDDEIGIIAPYARQCQKIRAALEIVHPHNNIKVGSVETFQGQERRVIILSTVRSEPELYVDHDIRYNLGFVAHPKRFNVAITRAKALLIVVGCPTVLALDTKQWRPFMEYCHSNGSWVGDSWDPSIMKADLTEVSSASDSDEKETNDEWELVQNEEQFVFVNHEE